MTSKTVTATNAVDTWADLFKPGREHPRTGRLAVQSGASGAHSYVYFGPPAPAGATILSAKLRLYTAGSWGGVSTTITAQRLTQKFVASKLNGNNHPNATASGAVAVTQATTGDGALWEFDLSTMMQLVANGTPWYGVRLVSSSTTRRFFNSAEQDELRPELVVTWADAPDQPTTLSPNEQVVNVSRPAVEMDYTDLTSGTAVAMQVLVSASVAMTSPFDTGEVVVSPGTRVGIDLATTAYLGVANGVTAYWQGRVKDESGVWSAYSNPASFTRYDKGTLSITSPSSGTPTVTEFTPTVTWTFTPPASPAGVTQEKYRVIVENITDGARVFDSGEVAGTGASEVIEGPQTRIEFGKSYRLVVRAWDTLDRVSLAASPAYVEATRTFTLASGATTGPGPLTITTLSSPPGLQIDFTRSTAPDSFVFLLDGVPVAVDVAPADVLVSGTSYRYVFRPRPNVPVTVGVSAVTGGITSPIVAGTATTMRMPGAWLIDKATPTRYLFIANTSGSELELGEEGATLTPLGSETSIRVTQAVRGYEGTVSGVLVAQYGRTLLQWVEDALKMRAKPGRTYIFMWGSESFECHVSQMKVRPTGDSSPGVRGISFVVGQTSPQRVPVTL